MVSSTVKRIDSVPLFAGLTPQQLQELATIVVDQGFGSGRLIFSEGDEAKGFYVVVSGRVKVFKLSPEGKEQILHIFGPGDPFGEVPVFAGQEFPAGAEAMEQTRVFFFPRSAFVDLIRKHPDLALGMLAILSRRLKRFTVLIEDLSLKEVPGRLAAYLVHLSERSGGREFRLDVSKAQLASLLGTIPETLSRILRKMKDQRLIDSDGARIRIRDPERLQDLAEAVTRL
jgi:CRP/FNR family transcriptional regulator